MFHPSRARYRKKIRNESFRSLLDDAIMVLLLRPPLFALNVPPTRRGANTEEGWQTEADRAAESSALQQNLG